MKQQIPIIAFAASAVALSTGCLSVTGFDAPGYSRPVEDTIHVSVDSRPTDPAGERLAASVKSAATQNIASRGFRIVEGGTPDFAVSFSASQKEFNRAGDFIVYDGRVDASVSSPYDGGRLIDGKTFSARGERALGETAATDKLCAAIVPQVDAWVSGVVSAQKLAAGSAMVLVEYHHVKSSRKAELSNEFLAAARGTPGIRDCQLVSETWDPGLFGATYGATYRIVYDFETSPNGPLCAIAVRNPGLGLSVIPAAGNIQ